MEAEHYRSTIFSPAWQDLVLAEVYENLSRPAFQSVVVTEFQVVVDRVKLVVKLEYEMADDEQIMIQTQPTEVHCEECDEDHYVGDEPGTGWMTILPRRWFERAASALEVA